MKTFSILILLLISNLFSKDFTYTYPSTRANSMGSSFSSLGDDAFAIFYNPAGLTQIKDWMVGTSINRKLSDKNLLDMSLSYIRPVPDTKDITVGFGYNGVRQSVKGRMDTYTLGYSNKTIVKYFQLPIIYGANIKIISLRYPSDGISHLGLGVDGGIILSSIENYRTSVVISNLTTGMGSSSLTTITIGNSYRYLDTTFVMDLRIRGGYSEFLPGVERKFFDDLLRFRAGKGINLDGKDYIVFGAGLNFDPLIIDLSFSYPWKGFQSNAGHYGFALTYKFTGPTYKERMFDDVSQKVKELNSKAETLKEEIKNLENDKLRYETQKGILESEITLLNTRYIELKEKVKEEEIKLIDLEFSKQKFKEKPQEKKNIEPIKKEEKWPKLHKVENGETLRSISSKYYGTPDMWKLIYDENQSKIFKGLPREGEILVIPPPKK